MPIYMVLGFVILLFSFSFLTAVVTYTHRKLLTENGSFVYDATKSNSSVSVFYPEDRADVLLCIYKNGRVTMKQNSTEVPVILFNKLSSRLVKYVKDFEQDFKS